MRNATIVVFLLLGACAKSATPGSHGDVKPTANMIRRADLDQRIVTARQTVNVDDSNETKRLTATMLLREKLGAKIAPSAVRNQVLVRGAVLTNSETGTQSQIQNRLLIRRHVRNIAGLYRTKTAPAETASAPK